MPEYNPRTHKEMSPMADIFPGRKVALPDGLSTATENEPSAFFSKSRAEHGWSEQNPGAGRVANHRPNDLALECPRCAREGKPGSRMFEKGGVGYYCLNQHIWKDWDVLMSLDPKKLPFVGFKARQEGHRKVELELPGSTLDDLQKKFGDRMVATLGAVFDIMAQERYLLMHEEDLKRAEQTLGVPVRNGKELMGVIWERTEERRNLYAKIENLEARLKSKHPNAPVGNAETSVTVDVGDMMDDMTALASGRSQSIEELIVDTLRRWKEANWL